MQGHKRLTTNDLCQKILHPSYMSHYGSRHLQNKKTVPLARETDFNID